MEPLEYERMASVEAEHWWWRARREIVARTLEQYAPKLSNRRPEVVEVGCGTGGNLPMLETFGRVLGAEHEPLAIDHLKKRHGNRFEVVRHAVPEALPRAFDILAMLDVLEHIEDDRTALDWVARQLVPDSPAPASTSRQEASISSTAFLTPSNAESLNDRSPRPPTS
jgi:SAM-dependent methyltransferase